LILTEKHANPELDPILTEEIHQVQEDKARSILQEVLKEKATTTTTTTLSNSQEV
jgi:hypothetical protein